MKKTAIISCAVLLIAACNKHQTGIEENAGSPGKAAGSAVATMLATKPPPTIEDWRAALKSTYLSYKERSDENGGKWFTACFEKTAEKCKVEVKGERDGFRKLTFFKPAKTDDASIEDSCPGVMPYVSIRDHEAPSLFLAPCYTASDWLFMNKLAVMVDGEVVFEREFAPGQVKRDNWSSRVYESYHFIVRDDDISKFETIVSSQSVAMRITGDKGHWNLSKPAVARFKTDLGVMLPVYRQLSSALKDLNKAN